MATCHSNTQRSVAAAAYIRVSSTGQEKSPAEQRGEITKLAAREGFHIVEWYTDTAITGDSTTGERPGLADLLAAAKAGKFKSVLAWHSNRISREDPMDAIVFYNQLRKADVGLWTCSEGEIDLQDFSRQLLLFVNQKGNNDFLVELSAKITRGKIATAKAGGCNGGPARYGFERGLFDADGHLVRRLAPGERVKIRDHRIQLVPTTDVVKLEAIRYAFNRMDLADVGLRELARDMDAKGYPSPGSKGWRATSLTRLLRDTVYIGNAHWGELAKGKYHVARGGDIVPVKRGSGIQRKPVEEIISVSGAVQGIIEPKQFQRVQAKLTFTQKATPRATRHEEYPLTGLMFCKHCGRPMTGATGYGHDRQGKLAYRYPRYVCSGYAMFKRGSVGNPDCGHQQVAADRVQAWLVQTLQRLCLGAQRDKLVQTIKDHVQAQAVAPSTDTGRMEKRLANLDQEVGRLVKAIRSIDAAELVEELALVRAERDRVKAELLQAGKVTTAADVNVEAEEIADSLMELGQRLADADPAIVREVFHRLVSRINCTWKHRQTGKRDRWELVEGRVKLRPQTRFLFMGQWNTRQFV